MAFRRKVLVIDDEQPVREAVSDILDLEGIVVLAAASGQEGIELYRQNQDDIKLILLDMSMPGMDGEQTLRHLRKISADVFVILSSGYTETAISQRMLDGGVTGFLQKPFDMAGLINTVRLYLDG